MNHFTDQVDLYATKAFSKTRHKVEAEILKYQNVPCLVMIDEKNQAYTGETGRVLHLKKYEMVFAFASDQEIHVGWNILFEGQKYKVDRVTRLRSFSKIWQKRAISIVAE